MLSTDRRVEVEGGEHVVGETKPLVRFLRLVQPDRPLIAAGIRRKEQGAGAWPGEVGRAGPPRALDRSYANLVIPLERHRFLSLLRHLAFAP